MLPWPTKGMVVFPALSPTKRTIHLIFHSCQNSVAPTHTSPILNLIVLSKPKLKSLLIPNLQN